MIHIVAATIYLSITPSHPIHPLVLASHSTHLSSVVCLTSIAIRAYYHEMATRRFSSLVGGKKNEAFDSSIANETHLAQMGYEQGAQPRCPTIQPFADPFRPNRAQALILSPGNGRLQLQHRHLLDCPRRHPDCGHRGRWAPSYGMVLGWNMLAISRCRILFRRDVLSVPDRRRPVQLGRHPCSAKVCPWLCFRDGMVHVYGYRVDGCCQQFCKPSPISFPLSSNGHWKKN